MFHEGDWISGRYLLEEVIGSGGSATVWVARDRVLSRTVAVKIVRPSSDQELGRLIREARVAALLGPDVAVPLYDFGVDGGVAFLVMERKDWPTLQSRLDDGPWPSVSWSTGFAMSLFRALASAHQQYLVHRDLKPANIFFEDAEPSPRVQLADFGLAFQIGAPDREIGRLTRSDLVSGTPTYMSPEQARGKGINEASDVYSAGCILYELYCRVPPFEGGMSELLSRHLMVPAVPPRERIAELPTEISDFVLSLLHKRAEQRPTAQQALDSLASLQVSRRARGNRASQPRSERMVRPSSSPLSPPKPMPRVRIDSSAPGWVQLLTSASRCIDAVEGEEELRIAPADSEPLGGAPTIAWTEGSHHPLELIRSGFSGAIRPATTVAQFQGLWASIRRRRG